jgi:WD40 repeat protein
LSPDASILAALGKDGTVRLWATREGRKIAELAHGKDIASGAFDPQGKKLATGSSDGVTKIWNLSTLQSDTPIVLTKQVHEITRLAFSPSGDRLVAVLADLTGRVWDAASGELLLTLADGAAADQEPKQGSISAVAYSSNGQYIATGKEGATVLWDAATGKKLGAGRTTYDTPILALSFSADGRRLLSAGIDWQTWVGEVPSMRTIKYIDTMTYEPFAYDAAGDLMVTTAYGVQLNDATTGRQVGMLDGEFETASLSANGAHLYATNKDGKAYVWSLPLRGAKRIAEARRLVPRCLTTLQLESAGLDPAPPRWCISGPDHVNEKDPAKWEGKWPYQTLEWREWLVARDRGESPQLPNLPGGGPPSPHPEVQQGKPPDAASAPETALPPDDKPNSSSFP